VNGDIVYSKEQLSEFFIPSPFHALKKRKKENKTKQKTQQESCKQQALARQAGGEGFQRSTPSS